MQENKLVSAIITTHNRLDLLKQAIKSVKQQTYIDIEVIVVDDASTDGTKEYCTALTGIHYIYISPAESKGGNHARNVGIRNANGYYIAFLDDDDIWLPEKTEKQVRVLESHTECHLCIGDFQETKIYDKRTILYSSYKYTHKTEELDLSKRCMYSVYALTSSLLFRKEIFQKVGLFDEQLYAFQETELIMRVAQVSHICRISEPLFVYRIFSNRDNVTNRINNWKASMFYIYGKHKKLYKRLSIREQLEVKHQFYAHAVMKCEAINDNRQKISYNIPLRICRILIRTAEVFGCRLR